MNLAEIDTELLAREESESLDREERFFDRAAMLELVESWSLEDAGREDLGQLQRRAEALTGRLERANAAFLAEVRQRVRSGAWTGEDLQGYLERYAGNTPDARAPGDAGYDALDAFVGGLLCTEAAPEETRPRATGEVALQPTPARAILQLVERAGLAPHDVFVDLGSGLGQVAILVRLLSGARAKGIEIEPAYCAYARRRAAELGLDGVEFVNADAREADYAGGTCFFTYTSFTGRMMGQVVERLRAESRRRRIRLCTYGPCTTAVAGEDWLRPRGRGGVSEYRVAVFDSRTT